MTTYRKVYKGLTLEQKSLLRDLLVYQISKYDIQNNISKRSTAVHFLHDIYEDDLIAFDSTMIMMDDIIKICRTVPENERANIQRQLLLNSDDGLVGILSIYSNETINGLKEILSSKDNIHMASTSSACWRHI
ncbi:MAG: hypothetical protein IJZ59_00620 [Alphaproteobacteria bacterium]|nr:hypothetical protein [Alphaproteobacteria bacterium]